MYLIDDQLSAKEHSFYLTAKGTKRKQSVATVAV